MKKRYISLLIIVVLLFILGGVWYFVSNHHTVAFDLKNGSYTVEIDDMNGKKITSITTNNASAWLWNGNYSYKITGDKYDNSKQGFTIKNADKEIAIDPNYSDSYLASLLTDSEYSAIVAALQPAISSVSAQDYSIQSLNLYNRGQWAAGTISYQQHPQDIPTIYRFVLEKTNARKVIVKPTIAIYGGDYPQIPVEILDSLYQANS